MAIDSNAAYQLQPADVTVAELLQEAGYATGGVSVSDKDLAVRCNEAGGIVLADATYEQPTAK